MSSPRADGETRTRTGDTTIFRVAVESMLLRKDLQINLFQFVGSRRNAVGFGRLCARLGLRGSLEVPMSCGDERPVVEPSECQRLASTTRGVARIYRDGREANAPA
jgi:hypothetical protein